MSLYHLLSRYARLYSAFFVNNVSRAMEFRAQFFAGIFGYIVWSAVSLLFIDIVFGRVGAVRGWTRDEMWVLYGTFVVLESLCYGVLGPNMWRFSGLVRDGGLDLALIKPVNTQFFVSTRYLDLNGVLNCVPGFALMFWGFQRLGQWPNALQWLLWLAFLVCGIVMAYSIWFAIVTLSIWFVKLESGAVAFDPVMQMAKFPVEIYPARMRAFLTFALPVAFLTTYPSASLLGKSDARVLVVGVLLAAFLLFLSQMFFRFALRFYGSASS